MNTSPKYTFISFLLILCAIYISFYAAMPQQTSEENVAADAFSTNRAFTHVKAMAKKPHYVGSPEHAKVRNYIVSELKKLGLQSEIQQGYTLDNWGNISKPKNVIAKIPGTQSGKALLLLSHYDSDPHSAIGASDAVSGVATIIEGVRAFLASEKKPKNDIILLLSDGEELGLNGAELFVNKHPWTKDVGLVLNFEARGSGGPSIMLLETNQGNQKLINAFKDAGTTYPVANSLAYSIYKMLPNDTDLTVFREDADIQGFNFAFIDDHFDYHTANDTPENLDFNTLTHQGSYLMPLLHYFSDADLSNLRSEDDLIYFNTPIGFHTYPFAWILPMCILMVLLFIGLVFYGVQKKKLSFKGILLGFAPFLLTLVVGCVATILGWKFILWIYPEFNEFLHGFSYNGYYYITMFALLSTAIGFYFYHRFREKISVANMAIAPLFFWIIISILAALYLEGASFISIPILLGLLSLFLLIQQQKPNVIILTVLSIPAVFILTPFVKLFPVGLGLKTLVVVPLLISLLIGLLVPVIGHYKRRNRTAQLLFLATIVVFFMAQAKSDFTEERQKPNSLVYILNADNQSAEWATYDNILDDWTRNYVQETSGKVENKNIIDSKYKSGFTYSKSAQVKVIPEPTIEMLIDTVYNNLRHVEMHIIPQRTVNRIELFGENTGISSLEINGNLIDDKFLKRRRLISYYVSDNEPLQLKFTLAVNTHPELMLYEASFDLLENPLFSIPERPKTMIPKPFVLNDAVLVKKTIKL